MASLSKAVPDIAPVHYLAGFPDLLPVLYRPVPPWTHSGLRFMAFQSDAREYFSSGRLSFGWMPYSIPRLTRVVVTGLVMTAVCGHRLHRHTLVHVWPHQSGPWQPSAALREVTSTPAINSDWSLIFTWLLKQ